MGHVRHWRLAWAGLLCASALVVPVRALSEAGVEPSSIQEIEESLTCQCGCGLTVHSCNHLQCPSAIPLREEIHAQMQLSPDKQVILDHFSAKYGEKILSSPTTSGFNLLAWVTPFVLVALGGVVVGITLLRWRRHRVAEVPAQASVQPGSPSAHEKILERELKNFDG